MAQHFVCLTFDSDEWPERRLAMESTLYNP